MELLVNGLAGWVATDDAAPTFSLRLKNTERFDQVRVTVAEAAGGLLWDGGVVPFDRLHWEYGGPPLEPKTAYVARAGGYLDGEQLGECQAVFETGFLGREWDARWIEPEQEPAIREKEVDFHELFTPHEDDFGGEVRLRPCRELRRAFVCAGPPDQGSSVRDCARGLRTVPERAAGGTQLSGSRDLRLLEAALLPDLRRDRPTARG